MGTVFAASRIAGLTPQQFFGAAMWIGFVSTIVAREIWIRSLRTGKGILPKAGRATRLTD